MYKTQVEARALISMLGPLVSGATHCDVVVAPPFTAIPAVVGAARGTAISVCGQDLFWEKEGAFTGEVSAAMLVEAGCRYVIVGHSERRQFFGETDETVCKKTKAALAVGLTPIVCVGETLDERESGATETVLGRQFRGSLAGLTTGEFSRILIAYEPVWAIGTGRVATSEQAAAAHKFLRNVASSAFSSELASALRILYGGSVKPDNIEGLMVQDELDGALVGGASLDAKSFGAIVNCRAGM
jgi:triosephosphate isomerase